MHYIYRYTLIYTYIYTHICIIYTHTGMYKRLENRHKRSNIKNI